MVESAACSAGCVLSAGSGPSACPALLLAFCWQDVKHEPASIMLASSMARLWRTEPDTTGLPYTAPVELLEGTDKDYWEFETDNYAWQSTALAAARTGSQFRGESGEHVRNAADRLRFELLAKALYRERKAEFLENRPDAVETVVENKAFDEAILLAGGDRQMLLIRKGTIVYALWVDFPADLGGSMENVAAELAAGGP